MLRLLLVIALSLYVSTSFSQIKKIEQNNPAEKQNIIGEVYIAYDWVGSVTKVDNRYYFNFIDKMGNSGITFFFFREVNNDFEKLYQEILNGFRKPAGYSSTWQMENAVVKLFFSEYAREKLMHFQITENGRKLTASTVFNRTQINKLFGK